MGTLKTAINTSRQPAALSVLFLVEMWERFGFYIIQGLLILYLTEGLGWSDDKSYSITGAFTGFVYVSPLIGGYVADKILGFKNSIILGGILLAVGYALLAGLLNQKEIFLYLSLSIIIIGNGFFKPNVGSLLGTFYREDDPRREAGFTWFYMGINVGSMFATLAAGFVKDKFGWPAGFSMASIGLLLGISNFLLGFKYLKNHGLAPQIKTTAQAWTTWLHTKTAVGFGILLTIVLLIFLLQQNGIADILLSVVGIALIAVLLASAFKQDTLEARHKMLALIMLTLFAVIFWAIFFQIFFSANLFIERNVDRVWLGYQIPTVIFISFESIFLLVLSPFVARFWTYLASVNKNPSIPFKFFLSFLAIGVGFSILALGTYFPNSNGLIPIFWIPLSYLFVSVADLLLSPIGLSAVTMLAESRIAGMMMGVWLIAIGYGGKLAGFLATFTALPPSITDKLRESHHYGDAFLKYALICFATAIVILIGMRYFKRLIHSSE